jgi:hypothetical protein
MKENSRIIISKNRNMKSWDEKKNLFKNKIKKFGIYYIILNLKITK